MADLRKWEMGSEKGEKGVKGAKGAERMGMKSRLTRKQLAVLDDLFGEDASASEGQILAKHAVKPVDYRRWHGEEAFSQEFSARMDCLSRQSRLLIARYAS
jgi:hypothetical protein